MSSETTTPMASAPPAHAAKPPAGDSWSPRAILGHLAAWIAILAAMVFMLHAGWERWNDPIVDFGRELYLPWQITQGKVLYRDLASFNGPLSPYVNALWFKLFGVGLHTLIYCNIAITLAIIAMLYRLAFITAGTFAAGAACLTFVFISGFSQFGAFGNENYLAPYSHEATHGIALSFAALLLLHRFLKQPGNARLAAVGLLVGLVFLTKVEIFLATSLAVGVAFVLYAWSKRLSFYVAARQAAALIAGALVPPLIAFLLLALAMPAREALLSTLGSLRYAINPQLSGNAYYQRVLGMDAPFDNLRQALAMFAGTAALIGIVWMLASQTRASRAVRVAVGVGVFAVVAGALRYKMDDVPWGELSRSLTLWMLVIVAVRLAAFWRRRHEQDAGMREVFLVAWAVFAGAMLFKMFLHARLNHYGFVLAMPALTLCVVAACGWLAPFCGRMGGSPGVLNGGLAGALVIFILAHVQLSCRNHAAFIHPIGEGRDRFLFHHDGPRATNIARVLDILAAETRPGETIVVMPEGVMLNYLLRRVNPSPYTFYVPSDLIMFGERRIIDSFDAHPPDYVVFISEDMSQFGVQYFGRDYAQAIHAWVLNNYHEVYHVGPPPFSGDNGGIVVLARNR